jgi:hypothetical protein
VNDRPDIDGGVAENEKSGCSRLGWLIAAAILGLLMAVPGVTYGLFYVTLGWVHSLMWVAGAAAILVLPLALVAGFIWRPFLRWCKLSILVTAWLGCLFLHAGYAQSLTNSCALAFSGGCKNPTYTEAFVWPLNVARR